MADGSSARSRYGAGDFSSGDPEVGHGQSSFEPFVGQHAQHHDDGHTLPPDEPPVASAGPKGKSRPGPSEVMVWVDFMRCVACVLVLLGHNSVETRLASLKTTGWSAFASSVVYSTIHRCSVPLFFMISGFFMLHKTEPLDQFYRRRIPRIIVPLIAWTVIYLALRKFVQGEKMDLYTFFELLVSDFGWDHLWFLYALLGCYLVTPFLHNAVKYSDPSVTVFCVVLWLVSDSLWNSTRVLLNFNPPLFNQMQFPRGFIGYYLAGSLGKFYPKVSRTMLTLCSLVYVATASFVVVATISSSYRTGRFYDRYLDQQGVFVALLSLPAFVVLRVVGQTRPISNNLRLAAILRHVSDHTYGIYLCHIVMIFVVKTFVVPHLHAMYRIPLHTVLSFLLSYAFVYVVKRVPLLNEIVQ